jgi:hypothetical protein
VASLTEIANAVLFTTSRLRASPAREHVVTLAQEALRCSLIGEPGIALDGLLEIHRSLAGGFSRVERDRLAAALEPLHEHYPHLDRPA